MKRFLSLPSLTRAFLPPRSGGSYPRLVRNTYGGPYTTTAATTTTTSRQREFLPVQTLGSTNYYKNMYDSLMEMYSTGENAISVTRFIDVSSQVSSLYWVLQRILLSRTS